MNELKLHVFSKINTQSILFIHSSRQDCPGFNSWSSRTVEIAETAYVFQKENSSGVAAVLLGRGRL
jgi:hypothetical protein